MSLDRFRSVDIRIDKADHYFMSSQFAKGGDYNGRTLVVQITNGGLIESQAGITVNLGWRHESVKNSGLDPFEVVDAAQGIFEISYPKEMLNPGRVTAVIQIIDGETITETKNFVIQVEKSPIDETSIVSSNSFTVLQEALVKTNRVEGLLNEAIANVTVDSEVITARNSTAKGKTFTVIDERIEEVERDVYFPAENILPNDDFANSSGWTTNGCSLSVYKGDGEITISAIGPHVGLYATPATVAGNKYYISAEIYPKWASYLRIGFDDDYTEITSGITAVAWNRRSVIKTRKTSAAVIFYHNTEDGNYVIGDKFNFRRMFVVDLTKVFGAGFEPSVDQMDRLMAQFEYKWFKGIGNLSQPALLLAKTLDMGAQFTAAINGVTVDSETINARVGKDNTTHATLKARLDNEKATTDQSLVSLGQQLEQAEAQIDLLTRGIGETFATLADLQTAYPTGDTKDHIVAADGHRYFWNDIAWADGGAYQAVEIINGSVTPEKTNMFDATISKNKYNPLTVTDGKYMQLSGIPSTNATYLYTYFIKVSSGDILSFSKNSGGSRVALSMRFVTIYDANKTVVLTGGAENVATYTVPNGVAYVICTINKSTGYIDTQIEITADGIMTAYEPYFDTTYTLKPQYIQDYVAQQIHRPISIVSDVINIPSKIRELTTMEASIFYENIINNSLKKEIAVTCISGIQSDRRLFGTFLGDTSLKIEIYDGNDKLTEKSSTLIVKDPATITNDFVIHYIGDSTTGNIADRTNNAFSGDVYSDATFIGTKLTGITNHDGRSGWSTVSYVTRANVSGVTNAFWNPTTLSFDYTYFMQQTGYTVPTHVVFMLGINDVAQIKTDSALITAVATAIANLNTMFESVHTYNPNVKICLTLPTPPNVSQEKFSVMYQTQQWRYKRNYDYMISEYIREYDNREEELLYVIPMGVSLDTTTDLADAVHPIYSTGSDKAGKQVYKAIKCIG